MLLTRSQIEAHEHETLAPYATFSDGAKREYPDEASEYRTAFQRDHARIIHSKSFRRLKGKTQVFVAHHGDHFRNRLSHTLEVAQISRNLARNLGLNEDLAESIALAHDLGHTPFGHAGEKKLDELLQPFGARFEHNRQSRRILTTLEKKYIDFSGLNMTSDLLDGLAKHQSLYDQKDEKFDQQPSLEAQIVNLADEIAYTNHDLDDGLRAGILQRDDLKNLEIWQAAISEVDPKLPKEAFDHRASSAVIAILTTDLLKQVEKNITENKIDSLQKVQSFARPLAEFSEKTSSALFELGKFLKKNFYLNKTVSELSDRGVGILEKVFQKIIQKPNLLTEEFSARLDLDPLHIVAADFVAGMTDNYAEEFLNKL